MVHSASISTPPPPPSPKDFLKKSWLGQYFTSIIRTSEHFVVGFYYFTGQQLERLQKCPPDITAILWGARSCLAVSSDMRPSINDVGHALKSAQTSVNLKAPKFPLPVSYVTSNLRFEKQ